MLMHSWGVVLSLAFLFAQIFTTFLVFNFNSVLGGQIQTCRSRIEELEGEIRAFGGPNAKIKAEGELKESHVSPKSDIRVAPGTVLPSYLSLVSPSNIITKAKKEELVQEDKRGFYGGKGDATHLGGFTEDDRDGQSPSLWTWMMKQLIVQSVVDVGCGRGISTKWFQDHGAKVLCVEGSSDAVSQSLLAKKDVVQHDFSRGPWWPAETFDVAWAVEFVEHVGRQYMENYYPIFKRAALIFVTHSYWGGWHHVEVHGDYWWKARMEMQGFVFSSDLTRMAHSMAAISASTHKAQHLVGSLMVFINPEVASLPKHAHLMGVDGCFGIGPCGYRGVCPCKDADALPPQFEPIYTEASEYDEKINRTEASLAAALKRPENS